MAQSTIVGQEIAGVETPDAILSALARLLAPLVAAELRKALPKAATVPLLDAETLAELGLEPVETDAA